jgi:hypothetical protein
MTCCPYCIVKARHLVISSHDQTHARSTGSDPSGTSLQTSTGRDTRIPCHDDAIALHCLQALTRPQLREFPKVRRIRRICDISFIVEVNVTIVVISCTERQEEIVNVVYCLIGRGGEFFEDTLGVDHKLL